MKANTKDQVMVTLEIAEEVLPSTPVSINGYFREDSGWIIFGIPIPFDQAHISICLSNSATKIRLTLSNKDVYVYEV